MKDLVLVSTHDLPRAGEMRDAFRRAGYAVDLVTPDELLSADREPVLLVLTGGVEGSELAAQAASMDVPVFGLVAAEDVGKAVPSDVDEVFSRNAVPDDVALIGHRTIERRRLQALTGIVGETDAMRVVLERVVQIAPVASTVLITGESGTGKELVARGIHALSPRRHKPFIAVNVAALSETLLESELFGHEKGAFTGAIDARRGLFELAHEGTIFLDEIGEMPLATQTKLLRVLEQREFLRVGGEKSIKVDVRIITATNQELRELVVLREFRRDLYFRLNVLHIELPPLRDRPDDIPLLVREFVREVSSRHDRAFPGITSEAMRILMAHSWPGNVRELRNLVESMVVLGPGRKIGPEDIPRDVRGGGRSLLPVPIPRPGTSLPDGQLRPELEFVFRTLVELRVDMDDLRRDFETYRRAAVLPAAHALPRFPAPDEVRQAREIEVDVVSREDDGAAGSAEPDEAAVAAEATAAVDERVVIFRPGMTMDDMERETIRASLHAVGGNRRKAAEQLGIGERTLYRKIKKYGLDD